MITRAQIRRQLRAQGGITNTVPREGFFLGGIKKRLRKLIPNELADFAVKAAPFVAPFQPGIAAAMRGIGRFDQRGSVSDALKQGLGTYALGRGARFLTGAKGTRGGPSTFSMDRFREGPVGRLFKKPLTEGDANKGDLLGTKSTPATTVKGLKSIRDATSLFKDVPILGELPSMVQQQILVGGVSAAGTYLYNAFLAEEPPQEEGETMEEYMARRRENVGNKMRTYFDNYFKFDKEYSSMTDEQKDAFVARYNMASGGRVGYQTGGISMGNTLAQNIAANQAQAGQVQQLLQAARSRLPQAAPAGITSVPTSQAQTMAAPQPMAAPQAAPQATTAAAPLNIQYLSGAMTPSTAMMPGGPGMQDPRLKRYGIKQADFDKMSMSAQDELLNKIEYANQYGAEPQTQAMILGERGVDSSKYVTPIIDPNTGRVTPKYDRLGLMEAKLRSDMDELYGEWSEEAKKGLTKTSGKTITGQESFQDLLDLEKYYRENYIAPVTKSTTGTTGGIGISGTDPVAVPKEQVNAFIRGFQGKNYYQGGRIGYAGGSKPSFKQWVKMQGADIDTLSGNEYVVMLRNYEKEYPEENRAQGGRIGYAMGTGLPGIPTGDMRRNRMGVMERDYRDEGGFVPVGVKEKADDVPAMLSKNEFVMTADAVRGAGDGNINKGAQRMYDLMKQNESKVV